MRTFVCLSLLLLSACELIVDIDVPRADPLLAVDAPFEVGQPWEVGLSSSVPVQDGDFYRLDPRVTGAVVEVYKGDALVERLREADGVDDQPDYGYYTYGGQRYVGTTTPQAGHTYTLRISHPNYPPVTATDMAPLPIDPADLSWETSVRPQTSFGTTYDEWQVALGLTDDAQTTHYALGFSVQRFWPDDAPFEFEQEPPGSIRFSSPSALFVRGNNDPFDLSNPYYDTGFFADDAFRNGSVTLRADLERSPLNCNSSPDLTVCQTSQHYGSVYSVSPAYFAYVRSLIAYQSGGSGDNPLSEPTRIQGNVEGGLGLFAGRARTQIRLDE